MKSGESHCTHEVASGVWPEGGRKGKKRKKRKEEEEEEEEEEGRSDKT